jgi:hypothetical protein
MASFSLFHSLGGCYVRQLMLSMLFDATSDADFEVEKKAEGLSHLRQPFCRAHSI